MSGENISENDVILPSLYLGKDTIVTGNKWDFGNARIYSNILPTEANMLINKSYVDNLISIQENKIDTILDGADVSVENFKEFVDFVNKSQRKNEAELYASINDISFAIINEIARVTLAEDEIKSSVQNEVIRATESENSILTSIEDLKTQLQNQIQNINVNTNINELVQAEVTRATEAENKINNSLLDVRTAIQNETNRSLDAVNANDIIVNEIKSSVQYEVSRAIDSENSILNQIEDLKNQIQNINITVTPDNEEKSRAIDAEKSLEDKINALYQYFFKSNTIPTV
jgi:hypothetical protein